MSFLISLHHQTAGGEAHWHESEGHWPGWVSNRVCAPLASSLTHLLHTLLCNMRRWDKGISKVSSSSRNQKFMKNHSFILQKHNAENSGAFSIN